MISWPGTSGYSRSPQSPVAVWISEWQMPAYSMSMEMSSARSSRRVMVRDSRGWAKAVTPQARTGVGLCGVGMVRCSLSTSLGRTCPSLTPWPVLSPGWQLCSDGLQFPGGEPVVGHADLHAGTVGGGDALLIPVQARTLSDLGSAIGADHPPPGHEVTVDGHDAPDLPWPGAHQGGDVTIGGHPPGWDQVHAVEHPGGQVIELQALS